LGDDRVASGRAEAGLLRVRVRLRGTCYSVMSQQVV
jgi:hypothetical protein